jgi:hypothetical protein
MRTGRIILHIAGQGNGREGVIFRTITMKRLTAENAEFAEVLLVQHREASPKSIIHSSLAWAVFVFLRLF